MPEASTVKVSFTIDGVSDGEKVGDYSCPTTKHAKRAVDPLVVLSLVVAMFTHELFLPLQSKHSLDEKTAH